MITSVKSLKKVKANVYNAEYNKVSTKYYSIKYYKNGKVVKTPKKKGSYVVKAVGKNGYTGSIKIGTLKLYRNLR